MLELSRDCRESMTLSSRFPHFGQRMVWSGELTPLHVVVGTLARNFDAHLQKKFRASKFCCGRMSFSDTAWMPRGVPRGRPGKSVIAVVKFRRIVACAVSAH